MARINFRQGIVRYQMSEIPPYTPTFLQVNGLDKVDLVVSPTPTVVNFADEEEDYLFEESATVSPAWINIPLSIPSWLYWDIDALTGERTFGFTNIKPGHGTTAETPVSPATDQHFFDTTKNQMLVYNGKRYVPKIRVFAGKKEGSVIDPFPLGTQVGLTDSVYAGYILYDDDNISKPIKRFDRKGRGKFITTETPVLAQYAKLASYKIEPALVDGKASEPIPVYYCVAYTGPRELGLARYMVPSEPCVGIATEEFASGEVHSFLTRGYISDDNLSFTGVPGSPLFVGATGELITAPPTTVSSQQVAIVIDEHTIFVDIQQVIHYEVII